MASVSSYDVASFPSSSDRGNQLTQSPRADYIFHSLHPIPDSSLTIELTRLLIATIVPPLLRSAPHPFVEPRRMTPTCPRENQGGFYDILQQIATRSARAGVQFGRRRLSRGRCSWRHRVYDNSCMRQGVVTQPHANFHTP